MAKHVFFWCYLTCAIYFSKNAVEADAMSKRTVVNENYRGLVEDFSISAELHDRADGRKYATFGDVVPIHCCTPEQVAEYATKTHHYCDVFTQELLAPLGELAYVRLDEHTAEKVFINRTKRLLVVSGDGRMAQWRCAPSFESGNQFIAGAPIVNQDGALVSVVTARKGNHYAVSTFEGEGGYFETPEPWRVIEVPDGRVAYGLRTFASRDELKTYVSELSADDGAPLTPALLKARTARTARLALVAAGGRQLAHLYLQHGVIADVEYL